MMLTTLQQVARSNICVRAHTTQHNTALPPPPPPPPPPAAAAAKHSQRMHLLNEVSHGLNAQQTPADSSHDRDSVVLCFGHQHRRQRGQVDSQESACMPAVAARHWRAQNALAHAQAVNELVNLLF